MSDGPAERSVDEVVQEREQEFNDAVETIKQRKVAEDRGASDHEIAALEPIWHAFYEAKLEHWRTTAWLSFAYVPPPEDDWDELVAELRKPPRRTEFERRLAELPPTVNAEIADRATRPLDELSPVERERLEGEVAWHVATGKPSIHGIANRFGITRRQVRNRIAAMKRD